MYRKQMQKNVIEDSNCISAPYNGSNLQFKRNKLKSIVLKYLKQKTIKF